ncbi:MAG TPA: acetylglutamate kinase [Gaiellaceae bacterium]|nr:acetylglutamate kinase [Gaiellaceae bacterium]
MSRVVVKLGGRVAASSAGYALDRHEAGDEVVVVHGAGPQISAELERLGRPVTFVDGRRFTDGPTLEVVRSLLVEVGAEVAATLGSAATHLVGDEIGLEARPLPGLGLVGDPVPGAPPALAAALAEGRIPVVTPIAVGPLNVNADEAASAIAVGLGADRIVFVSDVPGVYVEGVVADVLHADHASALLSSGAFEGGIVPKLVAAVRAARLGVQAEIGLTEVLA